MPAHRGSDGSDAGGVNTGNDTPYPTCHWSDPNGSVPIAAAHGNSANEQSILGVELEVSGCGMSKHEKTRQLILDGRHDATIRFDDLRGLLLHLGFAERIRGSHHIFVREGVDEILNLQPRGAMAKPYQVKQVRNVMLRYRLGEPSDAE
jgi:hypothetical protein